MSDQIEGTLTKALQNLVDKPDNTPFRALLRRHTIHVTDIRVKVQAEESNLDRIQRELRELREWGHLRSETMMYKWDDFVAACSRKTDITKRWQPIIEKAVGASPYEFRYAKEIGVAKAEWLSALSKLPDWSPNATTYRRTNFADVATDMVVRLRHAGMTPNEIAKAFNDFLRDFNGADVTEADVHECW